jgi:hypothetical protein
MHRTPKNENREVKGLAIMSLCRESSIKRNNKLHYKVKHTIINKRKRKMVQYNKKVHTQQWWASKRRMEV